MMSRGKNPNFSQIVCSEPSVREAFVVHCPTRFWWRLILMLHGKPVDASLPQAERTQHIAAGFKFYAGLYRFLAVIFLLLAPLFVMFDVVPNSHSSSYWSAVSLLAGIYLWCVSGLGYAGAKSYGAGQSQGTSSLIAFMVMIVAFLSLFIAVISVTAHHLGWLATLPNLSVVSLLFVLGVGSYMIEILYLAMERQVQC